MILKIFQATEIKLLPGTREGNENEVKNTEIQHQNKTNSAVLSQRMRMGTSNEFSLSSNDFRRGHMNHEC